MLAYIASHVHCTRMKVGRYGLFTCYYDIFLSKHNFTTLQADLVNSWARLTELGVVNLSILHKGGSKYI